MDKLSIIDFRKEIRIFGGSEKNQEIQEQKYPKYRNKEYIAGVLLILVALPELLIYSGNTQLALFFYAFILLALSLISIFVKEKEMRNLSQVIMLLPILRLINFSVPIFPENYLLSLVFIYTPLMIPIIIITTCQQFTHEQLGLSFKQIQYYFPASIFIGFILGQGESFIMQTTQLIPEISVLNILKLMIVMVFFVGLTEGFIFRSILQTKFEQMFGSLNGLALSSLIFGLMNSGYGTLYEILYALFVGLFIGYLFQKTRSLPFIALIQGFINVFSFGIIPCMGHGLGIL